MSNFSISKIIEKICSGKNLIEIMEYCINDLYFNGPKKTTTLETLSLIKLMHSEFFSGYESEIVRLMGLFFKNYNDNISDFRNIIFEDYKNAIYDIRNERFTPMQNKILGEIGKSKNYSFSSPTSTGKSYIFKYLIKNAQNDILIVVPSRALINEFYINVTSYIDDKETLVLTFVDNINKKHTKRRIFILTPERARDVFRYKREFNFDFFLFDEAQLTNEDSERGIYYDGIVRRLKASFPNTKFIFSQPFIANPEVQFTKNGFDLEYCKSNVFEYKNSGQLFMCHDRDGYYIFGTNKEIMGNNKIKVDFNPLVDVLKKKDGCVLIYSSKAAIVDNKILNKFKKFIDKYCVKEPTEKMLEIIEKIKPLLGVEGDIKSTFIDNLYKGIVIHHGSMPLEVRILLEDFIKEGFCKMCFATSTLAQGVNMPFDLVYIDRFEKSQPMMIKNLIGRAGRSTNSPTFDYGIVLISTDNIGKFRKIIVEKQKLKSISNIDDEKTLNDNKEYKEAVKNNDFSDEYNLPNSVVGRVEKNEKVESIIQELAGIVSEKVHYRGLLTDINDKLCQIYKKIVFPGRELTEPEMALLEEANRIMLGRYMGKDFSEICKEKYRSALSSSNPMYKHGFVLKYFDFPNTKQTIKLQLFANDEEIDFDKIVYNTYDFMDKLIDLKLIDIYYVALDKYATKNNDSNIREFATKLKYGTDDEKKIMELRYGFSSNDFMWLNEIIDKIDEDEIIFNDNVDSLDEYQRSKIEKFIY